MSTIAEAFNRAFAQGRRAKARTVVVDSDSDSAEEASKKEIQKSREKQDRNGRNKSHKTKRTAPEYKVRHKIRRVQVNSKTNPEILSLANHDIGDTSDSKAVFVAETYFVNQRNSDAPASGNKTHVLPQHFPFVRALVQRPPQPLFDIHKFDRERLFASLEVVERKYEEEFLREPLKNSDERPCLFGKKCEGLFIKTNTAGVGGFILREFLLPSEQKEYERTGKYPADQRFCLMCKRKEIARAFVNTRADCMSMRTDSILQDYRNIVEMEGEYCLESCLLSRRHCYEGIIMPIVCHYRTAYELKEKNGVRYYVQWRMGYPESNEHFLFSAPSN